MCLLVLPATRSFLEFSKAPQARGTPPSLPSTSEQQEQQIQGGVEQQRRELEQQRLQREQEQRERERQQEQQRLLDQQREREREQEQQQQQQQQQRQQVPQRQQQPQQPPPQQQPQPQMLDQQDSHLSFEERLRARYRHHDVPSTLRPQHAFSAEQAIATFETILRETDDPTAAPGVNAAYREETMWYTQLASGWIDAMLRVNTDTSQQLPPRDAPLAPASLRGFPEWREPSAAARHHHLELIRLLRSYGVVGSPQEWAALFDGDGILIEGHAVDVGDPNGYTYPLANPRRTGIARSMGPGELIRHSLGRFVRIDLSPIAGHWNRWQLNGGPDEAEAAVMRQIARLVVLSEFPMTFTMGAPGLYP